MPVGTSAAVRVLGWPACRSTLYTPPAYHITLTDRLTLDDKQLTDDDDQERDVLLLTTKQ